MLSLSRTSSAGTPTGRNRGGTEQKRRALPEGKRGEPPTGFTPSPADLAPPPPKEWIERSFNLRRHTIMPKGGHFAALEEPELLVEDVRAFFRPLRFGAAND